MIVAGDLFDTAAPTARGRAHRLPGAARPGGRRRRRWWSSPATTTRPSGWRRWPRCPPPAASTCPRPSGPPGDGGVARGRRRWRGRPGGPAAVPVPALRGHGRRAAAPATPPTPTPPTRTGCVRILGSLTAGFGAGTVNMVAAHLMVMGGTMGGGERGAHTMFDYWVPATAFPGVGPVRGPRPPAPGPAARRARPAALLRVAAPARLRRDGQRAGGQPGRRAPGPAGARSRAGAPQRPAGGCGPCGAPSVDVLAAARATCRSDDHLRVVLDEQRPGRAGRRGAGAVPGRASRSCWRSATTTRPRLPSITTGWDARPQDLFAEYLGERDVADDRAGRAVRRAGGRAGGGACEAGPAGAGGLHRLPGSDRRRLRRRRPVRPVRAHRRRQDQHHRRHHLRPLRLGAPPRRPPGGGPGHQPEPDRGPGPPGLHGRRRALHRGPGGAGHQGRGRHHQGGPAGVGRRGA